MNSVLPPPSPSDASASLMFQEAGASAGLALQQLRHNRGQAEHLGEIFRQKRPRAVITIARGSSDHAATFARYVIETRLGILTASLAPSISSVYGSEIDLSDMLCFVISQSGRSPDLIRAVETAKQGGAYVLALVNMPDSPIEQIADATLPVMAGLEQSVAATKSFILTLTALTQLVAAWADDSALRQAVASLPAELAAAWQFSWPEAVRLLCPARNLFVVGRGLGFGIAQEAALKLKETCGLHAEAFSSAEVQHGPMALVKTGFPILALAQNDATLPGMRDLASRFAARDASVLLAGAAADGATRLPTREAHPVIEPILLIQSFYHMAATLAVARGYDPDHPPHLNKVTSTL